MKWLFGMIMAAVLAVGGYAAYLYFFKLDPMITHIGTSAAVGTGMSARDRPLSFLLLGTDNRPGSNSLNTDVIMVAAINPQTKKAVVVSIPRDTYMRGAMGLRSGKANAFYAAFHAENPSRAKTQIKKLFGDYLNIPIDYAAVVNFKGFEDVVEALGGVTVDVDMDMRYVDEEDGTDINLTKGVQQLSGKQTLDFIRYRKSNRGTAESNDIERNERQQKVIAAIIGKLKSPAGFVKLGQVFDAVGDNLSTDIPSEQIKTMLGTYLGIDNDKIQYIHLDGEWRSPYIYLKQEDLRHAELALKQILAK